MSTSQSPLLLPTTVFLAEEPDITVARLTKGLVLYLDEPRAWAQSHAADLCSKLVDLVGPERFQWFMTSTSDHWRPIEARELTELEEHLRPGSHGGAMRHWFYFCLADDDGAPGLEFAYREVDDRRTKRLGYVRLTVPYDHPSDDLLHLAIELGHTAPIWTGVGGYHLSVNPLFSREAFEWALRWSRRCLGLHLSRPDDFARVARRGLPGVSWLNLWGPKAIDALGIDLDELESRSWRSDVRLMRLSRGALLRAGEEPELGDVNVLDHPGAIHAVACALAPYVIQAPPPFPEPFGERASDWIRRFQFPESWS